MQLKDSVQLNPPPLRYRRIWILLAWGMVVAVVVLSLIPVEVDLGEGREKVAHFLAYGSLRLGLGMLFGGGGGQLRRALGFAGRGGVLESQNGAPACRRQEIAQLCRDLPQ